MDSYTDNDRERWHIRQTWAELEAATQVTEASTAGPSYLANHVTRVFLPSPSLGVFSCPVLSLLIDIGHMSLRNKSVMSY